MTKITASKARANLYKLLDKVVEEHKPIQIIGKKNIAVLISKEDWSAMQETIYLLSVPKMRDSIVKCIKTPLKNCVKKLKW